MDQDVVIAALMAAMRARSGCGLAGMSGSGATVFGLFGSGALAHQAAHDLRAALPACWVAAAPLSREIAGKVMPGAQRVIEYHLIARGTCWGHAIGQDPICLREGDLIVFPQGDAHVLSSAPGLRAVPDLSAFARPSTPLPLVYELGGGGPERTRIVCGFLGCDERPYNPLLSSLPAVIHLPAAGPHASTGWLETLLHIAVRESGSARAGGENVLARLAELFAHASLHNKADDAAHERLTPKP